MKKAIDQEITIIKLPPYTTDILQPLDVCCFRPLKAKWNKLIASYQRTYHAAHISRATFVSLIGFIWQEVFTVKNISSSFKKTGIYPTDRTVYPKDVFDPKLLAVYQQMKKMSESTTSRGTAMTPKKLPIAKPSVTFKQLLADSISPKSRNQGEAPRPIRHKIYYGAAVITDKAFADAIKEKNRE